VENQDKLACSHRVSGRSLMLEIGPKLCGVPTISWPLLRFCTGLAQVPQLIHSDCEGRLDW